MGNIVNGNILLGNCNDLIKIYENSRQLSEKLISLNTDSILTSSSICLMNNSLTITRWGLYALDGTLLYTSGKYSRSKEVTIYLSYVGVPPGTLFKLKSLVIAGADSVADLTLKCAPLGSVTGYFQLTGTTIRSAIEYMGTSYPW